MNISRVKTISLLLAAFAAFATAHAGTIHVAPGGTGAGTSWSDPLGDIQAAVNAAAANDAIQLAGGTFAVSSPVAIDKTVFIRGGYDPATGLPGATPTVVTRAGTATTGLVSVSGVTGGELRDVTLSGGVALVNASSASLTDCSILDNEAENVGKSGNDACGAGLYVAAGCSAAVTNGVVVRNNVVFGQNSQRGAGVYTEGAVSLFNCLVYNNVCRGSQNNVLGDGLCAYYGTASLALNFCTIAYNGTCGLYRQNGAVSASDSILWGNGDDVYDVYGTVALTRCNVADGDFNAASGEVFPWVFDKALDVAIAGAGAELTVFDAGGADASIARMTNATCIAFSGATFTGTAYASGEALAPAHGGAIGGFAS